MEQADQILLKSADAGHHTEKFAGRNNLGLFQKRGKWRVCRRADHRCRHRRSCRPRLARLASEAEANTQGHDASRQRTGNRAEVGAANIVRDLVRVEVQIVKCVVHIDPELYVRVFA